MRRCVSEQDGEPIVSWLAEHVRAYCLCAPIACAHRRASTRTDTNLAMTGTLQSASANMDQTGSEGRPVAACMHAAAVSNNDTDGASWNDHQQPLQGDARTTDTTHRTTSLAAVGGTSYKLGQPPDFDFLTGLDCYAGKFSQKPL